MGKPYKRNIKRTYGRILPILEESLDVVRFQDILEVQSFSEILMPGATVSGVYEIPSTATYVLLNLGRPTLVYLPSGVVENKTIYIIDASGTFSFNHARIIPPLGETIQGESDALLLIDRISLPILQSNDDWKVI